MLFEIALKSIVILKSSYNRIYIGFHDFMDRDDYSRIGFRDFEIANAISISFTCIATPVHESDCAILESLILFPISFTCIATPIRESEF
jgi:hypothetical protein